MRKVRLITRSGPRLAVARRPDRKEPWPCPIIRLWSFPPSGARCCATALADAVFYRDPPPQCDACESLDGLCDDCAAMLARARAYLDLGRELGVEVSA